MTPFGEWARRARVHHLAMTQREVSRQFGFSLSSVANWERGVSTPSPLYYDAWAKMADDHNIPPPPAIDRRRGPREKGHRIYYGELRLQHTNERTGQADTSPE